MWVCSRSPAAIGDDPRRGGRWLHGRCLMERWKMSHGLPWPLMRLQREVESYRQDRGGVKGMSEMPGEEDDFEEVATTCAARRKEKTQAAACGRCQQHQGKEGCMVSARCRGECGKGVVRVLKFYSNEQRSKRKALFSPQQQQPGIKGSAESYPTRRPPV